MHGRRGGVQPDPQKLATGGFVKGPSHGAGGVLAELEGGEYVLPKGHGIGTSTSPSNLITAGADVSGTIGGASATGVGNVWKRAKGYAKGGVAYLFNCGKSRRPQVQSSGEFGSSWWDYVNPKKHLEWWKDTLGIGSTATQTTAGRRPVAPIADPTLGHPSTAGSRRGGSTITSSIPETRPTQTLLGAATEAVNFAGRIGQELQSARPGTRGYAQSLAQNKRKGKQNKEIREQQRRLQAQSSANLTPRDRVNQNPQIQAASGGMFGNREAMDMSSLTNPGVENYNALQLQGKSSPAAKTLAGLGEYPGPGGLYGIQTAEKRLDYLIRSGKYTPDGPKMQVPMSVPRGGKTRLPYGGMGATGAELEAAGVDPRGTRGSAAARAGAVPDLSSANGRRATESEKQAQIASFMKNRRGAISAGAAAKGTTSRPTGAGTLGFDVSSHLLGQRRRTASPTKKTGDPPGLVAKMTEKPP